MKALTVAQPWASLIVAGVKTIETRPSPPNGPMADAIPLCPAGGTDRLELRYAPYGQHRVRWICHHCGQQVSASDGVSLPHKIQRGLPGKRLERGERIAIHAAATPVTELPLTVVLAGWRPGSSPEPWTWDDEAADLDQRGCCCRSGMCDEPKHLEPGQYQRALEHHVATAGLTQGILPGPDGRIWDGHHRIVAARRLGLEMIPIEEDAFALGAIVGTVLVADALPIVNDGAARNCIDVRPGCPEAGMALRLDGTTEERVRSSDRPESITDLADQLPLGDYRPGRWGWLLTDPKPTTQQCPRCHGQRDVRRPGDICRRCDVCDGAGRCEPVPVRGRQGVWEWTP